MRGGKSILFVIGGLLIAAFVSPVWSWFVERYLDQAALGQHGTWGVIGQALAMISPLQQFLFGAALGMFAALVIGYSETIRIWFRRIWYTTPFIPILAWRARSGRRYLGSWDYHFEPDQTKIGIPTPFGMHIESVGLNRDAVFINRITPDYSAFVRARPADMSTRLDFSFGYFGRARFWASLRLWLDLDFAADAISFEQMRTAFEFFQWNFLTLGWRSKIEGDGLEVVL